MKFHRIEKHYNKEAKIYGKSPKSTMPDLFIRKMEIAKIQEYIEKFKNKENTNVLEIGCGNGYTISQLSKKKSYNFVGVDSNNEMIKLALTRKKSNLKFFRDNILNSKLKNESFDIVYTERCLINLENWSNQKTALNEIHRVLKKGGVYIMIEAFKDGLTELNSARKVLGLNDISIAFHNCYFDKKKIEKSIKSKFKDPISKSKIKIHYENFLSSYYFGSRVLYPALIEGKKEIIYNNEFIRFFSLIPSVGNYSQIQLCVLQKI